MCTEEYFIITGGKGIIVDSSNQSITNIEWFDTLLKVKNDEIVIIGKDLIMKTAKVKDMISLQQSYVVLYKAKNYLNYI